MYPPTIKEVCGAAQKYPSNKGDLRRRKFFKRPSIDVKGGGSIAALAGPSNAARAALKMLVAEYYPL